MKTTLDVDTDKMLSKKVAKTNKGLVGMVYLPKELIGKNVTIVWSDEKK